jgi:hypothetical protein
MTAKEKAREIVIKIQFQKEPLMFEQAKQCALIAVDEMLSEHFGDITEYAMRRYNYLTEVKQEIEKL